MLEAVVDDVRLVRRETPRLSWLMISDRFCSR